MPPQETIRVALHTPDDGSRALLAHVLAGDGTLDLTDENDPQRDITLVHAALLPDGGGAPSSLANEAHTVVAFAPNDPALLAQFLAAGIRGYHCTGEPWSKLRDVLHQVHAGEIRSDPLTMNELLMMYLQLLREATAKFVSDPDPPGESA